MQRQKKKRIERISQAPNFSGNLLQLSFGKVLCLEKRTLTLKISCALPLEERTVD